MKKLKNIIIGWYRYLFKTQSKLAKNRLMICKNCSYKVKYFNQDVCDLCGCVLKAKVEVEDEKCYDNRW